jgi:hypothetical protein
MIEHDLGVFVGGVLRLNVDLGEPFFVLRLTLESGSEDVLEFDPEVWREVQVLSVRPEMVDDVVPLLRDLHLECPMLPDIPQEFEGVSDCARQAWV